MDGRLEWCMGWMWEETQPLRSVASTVLDSPSGIRKHRVGAPKYDLFMSKKYTNI